MAGRMKPTIRHLVKAYLDQPGNASVILQPIERAGIDIEFMHIRDDEAYLCISNPEAVMRLLEREGHLCHLVPVVSLRTFDGEVARIMETLALRNIQVISCFAYQNRVCIEAEDIQACLEATMAVPVTA
jgi:hypothetical protein